MEFPPVCPEIPVLDLDASLAYYREKLGFTVDWTASDIGLACLSRGQSRMFMTTPDYRSASTNPALLTLWVNLENRDEVDALHLQWATAGATIAEPPEAHDYNKLYEFFAADIDGNMFRVFYDFAWEARAG